MKHKTSNFKANTAVYQVKRSTKSKASKIALRRQNSRNPGIPDLAPTQKIIISVKQSQAIKLMAELSMDLNNSLD